MDNGEAGVWVWCGRQASKQDKLEAVNNAAVRSFVCLLFIIRSTYITPDMLLAIAPIYHRNGLD